MSTLHELKYFACPPPSVFFGMGPPSEPFFLGVTPPPKKKKKNPTSLPYLIKNERSLNHMGMVRKHNSAVILFKTCLLGAMLLKSINELYRRVTYYNDQETPSCASFSRKVTPGP